MRKWPTMRDLIVRMRHMPDIVIGASVSIDTGHPVVCFRIDNDDEMPMTASEARRVAAALVKAAQCCEAKSAYAKSRGTSVMNVELSQP